jgi:hypothetical protein
MKTTDYFPKQQQTVTTPSIEDVSPAGQVSRDKQIIALLTEIRDLLKKSNAKQSKQTV